MIWNLKNSLICVNIFVLIKCQGEDNKTTIKTIFVETTTELITMITGIPEHEVEAALNLDYGRYTTQSFAYFNSQFNTLAPESVTIIPCFDSHIRCLMTVVVPNPVCGVNIAWDLKEGFRTFETYCDAYFDNCLRRMRFWRIFDYGACYNDRYNKRIAITQTRRKTLQNFKNLFNLLSDNQITTLRNEVDNSK